MKLNDYLHRYGIGLNEFARQVGVDPATIHRIKLGTVTPHRRTMALIHKTTGGLVTPNDLLGLHGSPGCIKTERDGNSS